MVMPANGSGSAVPLAIYPLGSDLSGFLIFDPSTGQWMSGNGYTVNSTDSTQTSGVQPMDVSGDTNQYTGFYRVWSPFGQRLDQWHDGKRFYQHSDPP